MPIPPGGFAEDPRPPTLDELRKIWGVAKHFNLSHDFETESITVSFKISRQDCAEQGIHLRTFGSQFLGELKAHLDRLAYFDALVKQFTDPGAKGARVDDCIKFMEHEYSQVPQDDGLATTMRKRMFRTTAKKLEELKAWRIFVDKDRFESEQARFHAQEEAEKFRRAEEERVRRTQENMRRDYQERYEQRFREEYRQRFEEEMKARFYGGGAFHDFFRDAFKDKPDEEPHFDYAGFGKQRQRRRTKDKVRPTGKWFEILGVPVNSSKATIKSAWRKLAKTNHPDRGGDSSKMAEINAAKDEGLAGASS